MRSATQERDAETVWDVARPSRSSPVAGLSIAGFRKRSMGPVDLPVVPYPAVTLVLELGDGSLRVDDAGGRRQRGSLVAGLDPGTVRMQAENIECVEVRLSPVVAHAVLGASPAELDRIVVAVDDLWGLEASRIQEQLRAAPSWDDRFTLTEAWLARRRQAGRSVDAQVAWAWKRIVVSRGGVGVEDLAGEVGWSRKRLWSRFRSQIGLAPKRAAKLVRFNHAAHRLAAGESAAWVAAECGYVDQSHLHREVLAFTGITPATLAGDPGLVVDDLTKARHGTFVQDARP